MMVEGITALRFEGDSSASRHGAGATNPNAWNSIFIIARSVKKGRYSSSVCLWARCGVVGSGTFSLQEPPDPALETVGCVPPQWVQSSLFWIAAGCPIWVAAGCPSSILRKMWSSSSISYWWGLEQYIHEWKKVRLWLLSGHNYFGSAINTALRSTQRKFSLCKNKVMERLNQ